VASDPLRFLVAVDFSSESRAALRAARELARRVDGELTIAHVRPTSDVRAAVLEERGDLLRLPPGGLARGIATHYDAILSKLARKAEGETVRLLRGEPARELCREASRGYDILVMGSRGRGAAARFLLGSTVQEVLARASIPVLVLPARPARPR
jgi:nucleotide-binding universal stress UspA family protein